MSRHSKNGDEANRCRQADGKLSASSHAAASGGTVIQFPLKQPTAAAIAAWGEDGDEEFPSSFEPFGSVTEAICLRLRGGFPRVKVTRGAAGEREDAAPLCNQEDVGEERS